MHVAGPPPRRDSPARTGGIDPVPQSQQDCREPGIAWVEVEPTIVRLVQEIPPHKVGEVSRRVPHVARVGA